MVLMHDGGERSTTVKALPKIINALKKQGYRFVTVPELLDIEAKQPMQAIAKKPALPKVIKK